MVGDGHVFHSHFLRCTCHLLYRVSAIRVGSMTMNHALDVLDGDQVVGQFVSESSLNLTLIFAKLRNDILHSKVPVDILLALDFKRPASGPLHVRGTKLQALLSCDGGQSL